MCRANRVSRKAVTLILAAEWGKASGLSPSLSIIESIFAEPRQRGQIPAALPSGSERCARRRLYEFGKYQEGQIKRFIFKAQH